MNFNGRLRVIALLACGFSLAACQDGAAPTEAVEASATPPASVNVAFACTASVASGSLVCAEPETHLPTGLHASRIIGGQNVFLRLASTNVQYDDQAEIFSADLTVENLLAQPMGTKNGRSVHGEGVQVFFHDGPTVIGGAGTASVANPDGIGIFTATNQPYFAYPQVLAPGETSAAKNWRWSIPRTAENFSFTVYVSSPLQHPDGWVEPGVDEFIAAVGQSQTIPATARHFSGETESAALSWATSDPTVATVSNAGLIAIVGDGTAEITVSSGKRSPATILVGTTAPMTADSIYPSVVRPGEALTIYGRRLGQDGLTAKLNGVGLVVESASSTQAVLRVPAAAAFPCTPTIQAAVHLASGPDTVRLTHPFSSASLVSIDPGGMATLGSSTSSCLEMADPNGRYIFSMTSTARTATTVNAFSLTGIDASGLPGVPMTLRASRVPSADTTTPETTVHEAMLAANEAVLSRARLSSSRGGTLQRMSALPAVGDIVQLNLPGWPNGDLCRDYQSITARVAYVGPKTIAYEDVDAPLAGGIDAHIGRVMAEFEARQLGVLTDYFGDLFAMQGVQTPATGKFSVLLSRKVNDAGYTGFASAGDLLPKSSCAASNEREIVYIAVPTDAGDNILMQTAVRWERSLRSTLIHEAKHVVSYASRLAAGKGTWEDRWLEEATAVAAEELWARSLMPYSQFGNVGWGPVSCELAPTLPECRDTPVGVALGFLHLAHYQGMAGLRSPLGAVDVADGTYYGSGWSLVRWAADHSGMPEAQFFRALTQEPQLKGIANLEAQTGRSWSVLASEWALATALDGRSGVPARLSHPSWDVRGILWNGWSINSAPKALSDGAFSTGNQALMGGSSVVLEVARAGNRAFSLTNTAGVTVSIVRSQ